MIWLFYILFTFHIHRPTTPKDLEWKNRILIYSGEGNFDSWLDEGIRKGLEERKLLYFFFNSEKSVKSNFKGEVDANHFLEKLNQKQTNQVTWILVGLDGGIKKSGNSMPEVSEIFRLIDAMPMRRSEIKK